MNSFGAFYERMQAGLGRGVDLRTLRVALALSVEAQFWQARKPFVEHSMKRFTFDVTRANITRRYSQPCRVHHITEIIITSSLS
jgi:hypothetical protein